MELDKFYTKKEIAEFCLSKIKNINIFEDIIEPSAGNGSFLEFLPKYKAYDIAPENSNIIKQDYFLLDYSAFKRPCLVVGNPPFGKRSKLAIDFFNFSACFADTIAFIVPVQFNKWSVQKKLNNNFKLNEIYDIPFNSFYYEQKELKVRCVFQIWSLLGEDKRIKSPPLISHEDFEMWQYNNTEEAKKYFNKEKYKWDFAVPRQGYYDYSIREIDPNKMNKKIQWIFFKAKNKTVLKNLIDIDFEELSKKNTTVPGFGKADVVEVYNKIRKA